MRHQIIIACFATLSLNACASDIMGDFVGKDITQVMAQYGPPANSFDTPDGRKAFQWRMENAIIMPTTTTLSAYGYGNYATGTATTTGGYLGNQVCFYTLYAKPAPGGHMAVVGFEPPNAMCE
jgi:hypothetical protein